MKVIIVKSIPTDLETLTMKIPLKPVYHTNVQWRTLGYINLCTLSTNCLSPSQKAAFCFCPKRSQSQKRPFFCPFFYKCEKICYFSTIGYRKSRREIEEGRKNVMSAANRLRIIGPSRHVNSVVYSLDRNCGQKDRNDFTWSNAVGTMVITNEI